MGLKIKYPPSAIKKADREIKELMIDIIKKKIGGTTTNGMKTQSRVLNKISGDLLKKIKPVIKVNKRTGEIEIVLEVMEYFQYLDEGTRRIKHPWFLTDDFMNRTEFLETIQNLFEVGFENLILDTVSKNIS